MDEFKTLQEYFAQPCEISGNLQCLSYQSRAYALESIFGESQIPMKKKLWVYTPPTYTPQQKYDVLFLMHGGTDNEGYWFGTGSYDSTDTRKYTDYGNITASMVDHMVTEGTIKPLIIVAPSFEENVEPYASQGNKAATYFASSFYFWQEFRNEIMPLIQQKYSTWAEDDTDAGFAAAREHFAYAGASQGSITGLASVACHCLDRIAWIGSFSAGMIQFALKDQRLDVVVDEKRLFDVQNAFQLKPPHFWYCGCGDDDMMYATHRECYERLLASSPQQLRDGINCRFVTHPGGKHDYRTWIEDLYNILRIFF